MGPIRQEAEEEEIRRSGEEIDRQDVKLVLYRCKGARTGIETQTERYCGDDHRRAGFHGRPRGIAEGPHGRYSAGKCAARAAAAQTGAARGLPAQRAAGVGCDRVDGDAGLSRARCPNTHRRGVGVQSGC